MLYLFVYPINISETNYNLNVNYTVFDAGANNLIQNEYGHNFQYIFKTLNYTFNLVIDS